MELTTTTVYICRECGAMFYKKPKGEPGDIMLCPVCKYNPGLPGEVNPWESYYWYQEREFYMKPENCCIDPEEY